MNRQPPSRRFQFSITQLIVVMLMVAVACTPLGENGALCVVFAALAYGLRDRPVAQTFFTTFFCLSAYINLLLFSHRLYGWLSGDDTAESLSGPTFAIFWAMFVAAVAVGSIVLVAATDHVNDE